VEAGKNTVAPLMGDPAAVLPATLTAGQREASSLILQSTDRFTAVQGTPVWVKPHNLTR
jgi:hypothetical protein